MTETKAEHLYVLYGSQTGNSEQAAKDFCTKLKTKFTPEFFESQGLPHIDVETTCTQLDDFLEIEHAAYTKCLVIFVSSYGVGQAPMGAYRFREVCDAFFESPQTYKIALKGLKYALCGLGDSTYRTYLNNPSSIDKGLVAAGAIRIGEMGKADAHALGDLAQDKTIARWVEALWIPLAKALCAPDEVDTKSMQAQTIPLLMKLDPDYTPPNANKDSSSAFLGLVALALAGALAATAVAYLK